MRIMKAILIGILLCAGVGIKAQDKIQVNGDGYYGTCHYSP